MTTIKYVKESDKDFWYTLDKHLPASEFSKKMRDKMGYVIYEDDIPVGLLRYNLFWDNTPFLNLIFIDREQQKKGFGKKLMEHWEKEMKELGYGMVMVSTQVDEEAQHFYRKLGYKDSGSLVIDVAGYEQPMEMFMIKAL